MIERREGTVCEYYTIFQITHYIKISLLSTTLSSLSSLNEHESWIHFQNLRDKRQRKVSPVSWNEGRRVTLWSFMATVENVRKQLQEILGNNARNIFSDDLIRKHLNHYQGRADALQCALESLCEDYYEESNRFLNQHLPSFALPPELTQRGPIEFFHNPFKRKKVSILNPDSLSSLLLWRWSLSIPATVWLLIKTKGIDCCIMPSWS